MELLEVFKQSGSKGGRATASRLTKKQRIEKARRAGIASGLARAKKARERKKGA